MLEKIIEVLFKRLAPIWFLFTVLVTIGITTFEVKYFQLFIREEIILYFFFTFIFVSFVLLIVAKIFELSQENPIDKT